MNPQLSPAFSETESVPRATQGTGLSKVTRQIAFTAAILLIMLFGYAATSKLAERDRFAKQMELSPAPLVKALAPLLSWFIPLTEFVLVGMLLSDKWRKTGLYLSFSLLLVFQLYISAMLVSGLKLPCTCGGLISRLQWKEHLIFNAAFMLLSVSPFVYQRISKNIIQSNIHLRIYK